MKLIIEWDTPEECIEQIAQIYYLMATNTRDSLNAVLAKLDAESSPSELAPEGAKTDAIPATKAQKKTTKAQKKTTKAKESPKAEPKTEPEPEEATPQVESMDALRAAFVAKNSPENRGKLKAILTGLGVDKITDLPEKLWGEAFQQLGAI